MTPQFTPLLQYRVNHFPDALLSPHSLPSNHQRLAQYSQTQLLPFCSSSEPQAFAGGHRCRSPCYSLLMLSHSIPPPKRSQSHLLKMQIRLCCISGANCSGDSIAIRNLFLRHTGFCMVYSLSNFSASLL